MESTNYAIILTGGKQHKVSCGDKLWVEKLEAETGSSIAISEVLAVGTGDGSSLKLGTPLLSGASVKAKILASGRAKKVVIFKKKRRKGYTKKQGHRQARTQLLIESIDA